MTRAVYAPFVGLIRFAESRGIHPVCLMCREKCKKKYSFWSFQMPPEEFCDRFKERVVELEKRVLVLEPFTPGVNHYLTEVWRGGDGLYYITVQHGRPYPNDPRPTEYVEWEDREILAGPFSSPEQAEEWWFREK